jgi:glyoxylase-like metal-dependent hydrolase (beta-lactamase superfamily II)
MGNQVLYLGKIKGPKSIVTPNLDAELWMDCPYLGFLLKRKGRVILVDTGISEKFIIDGKAWGALPAEGGSAFVLDALKKEGMTPADVDTLIYTHLHNDHAGSCTLFKDSHVVVQKDEWLNLLNPIPVQNVRKDYDPDLIQELKEMKLFLIDGDVELAGGLRLIKPPGHSLGSQSIAVQTAKGVVVLCGDTFIVHCNAFPSLTKMTTMDGQEVTVTPAPAVYGSAMPSMIVYDYFAWYDSVYKIFAAAEKPEPLFVIPGHEPSLVVRGI